MDKKRFELTMESFFGKAGVELLKKGSDYQAGDEAAPYILLDPGRKTYYIAETDGPGDGLEDMEISAAASWLAEKEGLPEAAAKALLCLGRAAGLPSSGIELPGKDLEGLAEKSALIISEENAPAVKAYLDGRGISCQSAPLKGAFSAMFFDKNASGQIAGIYKTSSEEYMKSVSEKEEPQTAAFSFDDLLKDVPPLEDDAETVPGTQKPGESASISFDDLLKDVPLPGEEEKPTRADENGGEKDDDEKLLDDLDLSFMQKKSEPELSEEEGDLLYSKIINEQTKNLENAPSPKAGNAREIPKEVMESIGAEEDDAAGPDGAASEETPPETDKKTGAEAPAPRGGALRESAASKAASNLAGFIFFAPAYLIGKITRRVLPPFVIYWLAAIAVIFGVYQAAFSLISPLFYPEFTARAGEAAAALNALIPAGENLSPADGAAADMLVSSAVFFTGQAAAVAAAENGWLLGYMMSFGALLMIFPLSRSFGARITVFSVLYFFAAPFILGAQTYMLSCLSAWAERAAGAENALSALASGTVFTVFAAPVILTVALFWISGYFVPQKTKHKEVLP